VQLSALAPETYVRDVLPQTFPLWGDGRTYERYVADFLAVANSRYGRRRRHTVALDDDAVLGATCKLYSRELHWGARTMRAVGIGAVFTPVTLRGRGYASVMLGTLLDAEVAAETDLAFLFSDIRPQFYERLGFRGVPSRSISIRATSLDGSRVAAVPMEESDWPLVRRCFDALDMRRPWGFKRTPVVWEWIRLMWAPRPHSGVQPVNLVVRSGRLVCAYAFGRRVMRNDTFVVDEYGFSGDEGEAAIRPLLRMAAGDLARVSGWLPPDPARSALPRGSTRARKSAILMVAPLSALGRSWWRTQGESLLGSHADAVWSTDHV